MARIVIHAYRASWPAEFACIQRQLRDTLGDAAARVSHIGSTAVPGLGAKDVIDVQVGVAALSPELTARLTGQGYGFVPQHGRDHVPAGDASPPSGWQKLYFRERPGERPCHIHVRVLGSANHRYALLFRDYLRQHAPARATVERIKCELARLHGDDVDAYYAVKDPAYDLVWHAAQAWALHAGWQDQHAPDA